MHNLPVPADRPIHPPVNDQTMPGVPQVPAVRMAQPNDAWDVHRTLIASIQNDSQKNGVRTFVYNTYAANNFANTMYSELFGAVMDYYMALRVLGTAHPAAVQQAVNESMEAEIALLLQRYQGLMQVIPPHLANSVEGYYRVGQKIRSTLQQAQQQQQPMGMGHPQQQQPMGYPQQQQPMGMGYPQQPQMVPNGAMASQGTGGFSLASGGPSPSAGGSSTAPSTMSRPASAKPTPPPQPTPSASAAVPRSNGFQSIFDSTGVATDNDLRMGQKQQPTTEFKQTLTVNEPKIQWTEGTVPPVIRGNQMLVDERLHDTIKWGVADMNYGDHERNVEMMKLHKEVAAAPENPVMPRWDTVAMKPTPVSEIEALETSPEDNELNFLVEEEVERQTPQGAWLAAMASLQKKTKFSLSKNTIEVDATLAKPIGIDHAEVETLKSLKYSNLTGFIDSLVAMKGVISVSSWYLLHGHLTDVYNRKLMGGLGVDWSVDSIIDDYDDSIELISSEKSLSVSALDRFRDSVLHHIAASTNFYLVEEAEWGITTPISILHLPWVSREMQMQVRKEIPVGMLSEHIAPDMREAITEYVHRTNTQDRYRPRKLIRTIDDVWLEVFQSDYGASTIFVAPFRMY